jgi:hypothetical protein
MGSKFKFEIITSHIITVVALNLQMMRITMLAESSGF